MNKIKMPDLALETLIFYSNLVVFGLAAVMGLVCKFLDSGAKKVSRSNRYQSSNTLKESEIEFEFMSTYSNDDIV
jgi:hypothetical protein